MTITEIIAIILTASSLVMALSVLWAKVVHPIKRVVKQVEENEKQIKYLEDKIVKIKADRVEDNAYDVEVRSVLIEALIAVLDGLEQVGANHAVTIEKKKLISFLSKQTGG